MPDLPTPPEGSNSRVLALDVLRGVAILLVMARHSALCPWEVNAPLEALTFFAGRLGWIGVDLFFVLSGFLVSGLVFREHARTGSFRPLHFLGRRGLKIYPAFYAFLAVGLTTHWALGREVPLPHALSEALFVQNYWHAIFAHSWSLAVEEHFYLAIALVLTFMSRRGGPDPRAAFRSIVPLSIAVFTVCLVMRCVVVARVPYSLATHHYATHLRVDSLMFGVLLSYLRAAHAEALSAFVRTHRARLIALATVLLAPALALPLDHPLMHSIGFTAVFVGCGAVLLVAVHADLTERGPVRRAVAFVGFHSYSIYLWHLFGRQFAGWLIDPIDSLPVFFAFLLTYTLSGLLLALIAAWFVERPALRLRDRWLPSRAMTP